MADTKLGDLEIHYALLSEIETHPENANVGNVDVIAESIQHNGFYAPVVVQSSTGYILAGNHRYLAAQQAGLESVPVVYVDVDDEQAKRIMVVDNRTTRLGHDDDRLLATLLEELGESEIGLLGTGYSHADLQTLLDANDKFDDDLTGEPDAPHGGIPDSAFAVEPIPGAGGVCVGVMVTRFDHASLSAEDYNSIRVALGLGRAPRGALAQLGIEDWA